MNRAITILKILTAISFLSLVLPGGEINMPVWYILYSGLTGYINDVTGILIILLFSIPLIYLLISGFRKKVFYMDNLFSLISFLILYIPVVITIKGVQDDKLFMSHLKYTIFLTVSISSIFCIIRRAYLTAK